MVKSPNARRAIRYLVFGDSKLDFSNLVLEEYDSGNYQNFWPWWFHSSTPDELNWILSTLSEPWKSRGLFKRFQMAMSLGPYCSPPTFWLALGPCSRQEVAALRDHHGRSALHFAASAFGCRLDDEWGQTVIDLIRMGSDIHSKNEVGDTPLIEALSACDTRESLISHLTEWLNRLHGAGIDLEAYGRSVEKQLKLRPVIRLGQPWGLLEDFVVEQTVVGPGCSDWDLIGCIRRSVPIWVPVEIPGQWRRPSPSSPLLLWEPSQIDGCILPEGLLNSCIWRESSKQISSSQTTIRSLAQPRDNVGDDHRPEVFTRYKDDLEVMTIIQNSRITHCHQRSRSQPPESRNSREVDLLENRHEAHADPRWCGLSWHKCRLDSRWRLHNRSRSDDQQSRICMAGCPIDVSGLEGDILNSLRFAATRRQDGVRDYWDTRYRDSRHLFTHRWWQK